MANLIFRKWKNAILHPLGIDLLRFPTGVLKKRRDLFNKYDIDLILDVGANVGQYSQQVRELGYKNLIISFEPVASAFSKLNKVCLKDKKWICNNFALGNYNGEAEINVAENLVSSSILKMEKTHEEASPKSNYVSSEKILVKTLDSIFNAYESTSRNIFLKLDVQGFEKKVLEGAENSLTKIRGIQIEMSLDNLYESELLFDEMKLLIESKGFELCSLEPSGLSKANGKLLQVDGIFFRTESYNKV